MANCKNMKHMKRRALKRDGIEWIKLATSFFMLGNTLMLLSGLRTRRARIAFNYRFGKGETSIIPTTTTVKSSQFHGSLK
jgi:hypothetical protein